MCIALSKIDKGKLLIWRTSHIYKNTGQHKTNICKNYPKFMKAKHDYFNPSYHIGLNGTLIWNISPCSHPLLSNISQPTFSIKHIISGMTYIFLWKDYTE